MTHHPDGNAGERITTTTAIKVHFTSGTFLFCLLGILDISHLPFGVTSFIFVT